MAFSLASLKPKKATVVSLLALTVFYFGIYLYLGIFTIPYLTPAATYVGDCITPLTPAFMPFLLYLNIKQWNHRISTYRTVWWCSLMMSFCLVMNLLPRWAYDLYNVWKVSQGMEMNLGMMCFGRACWKDEAEAALCVVAVVAAKMNLQLDGGFFEKLWDKRVVEIEAKLRKERGDVEKGDVAEVDMSMEKQPLLA